MYEINRTNIKPNNGNYQIGATTVSAPIDTNLQTPPAYQHSERNILDYANNAYNQLAIKKNTQLFNKVSKKLDNEGKLLLDNLHKNGKLYSTDSADGSSTIENLNKILTEPRLKFFDPQNIAKETLRTLNDPYLITQNFGYIPESIIPQSTGFVNFSKGHTCPAASIEFDLADRRPAEFVRYVEALTSPKMSVQTKINYTDLLPNKLEAMSALFEQHTDVRPAGWNSAIVTIRPDKAAYLRADVQEDYRQPATRSMIDVLMQSAFMQLGSRGTYNTLFDERSKDTGDGRGLNQFEIAFVESIVDGKSKKVPAVYMMLDDDATKILQYTFPHETTRRQLIESLDKGYNIITGFLTNMDENGNLLTPDGHEIMITGYKYDQNGKLWFKYNDTDDGDYFAPSWLQADEFIPTIHHANIPAGVLEKDMGAMSV